MLYVWKYCVDLSYSKQLKAKQNGNYLQGLQN